VAQAFVAPDDHWAFGVGVPLACPGCHCAVFWVLARRVTMRWPRWTQPAAVWTGLSLLVLVAYVAWAVDLAQAAVVFFRLIALMLAALVVIWTTTTTELMAVVEALMMPLGRLGWVDPARVALLFGVVLRFIPILSEQWQEVWEAQAVRGLSTKPHALLIPMLARTLQRANEIAEAIDARGLG